MRIGHGYDAHRFCEDKVMRLGGVEIDSPVGLLAHSDGDVLLHALMDALLGAAGERDIGYQFPDNAGEYKNIDSRILLARTRDILRGKNLTIEYADMTVVAQKPKLKPYIEAMRAEIARVLEVDASRINVKATTEEKMGFTGDESGIKAYAVCMLEDI